MPTDGYLMLGYVAAFFLYYSVGAHVPRPPVVALVAVTGVLLAVTAAAQRGEGIGEYSGGITAVLAPVAVGLSSAASAPRPGGSRS